MHRCAKSARERCERKMRANASRGEQGSRTSRGAILASGRRMTTRSELMGGSHGGALLATVLLASASGARTMSGLAAASRALAVSTGSTDGSAHGVPRGLEHLIALRRAPAVIAVMAALELVGDLLPFIPDRTDALPMLGRVGAGALIGAAIGDATGRDRVTGAMIGAVAAWIATHATFVLRRELAARLPAAAAALIEDAVVVSVAAAGARRLSRLPARDRLPLRSESIGSGQSLAEDASGS